MARSFVSEARRRGLGTRKQRIGPIIERLAEAHSDAEIALHFGSDVELLISVMLSAQTTDVNVNRVTEKLFVKYRTPEDYLAVPVEELEQDIFQTGFYRQKTRSIRGAMRMLIEEFDGQVPRTIPELLRLPGVARKTANVVAAELGDAQGIVVDTHVRRLSQRLALTREEDPVKIERDLVKIVPQGRLAPLPASPDLARPARVRRAQAALRGVRDRGSVPVEPGGSTAGVGERLQSLPGVSSYTRAYGRVLALWAGEPERGAVLRRVWLGVRTCRPPRGTQGRLDRLRRPRRLDGGGRAKRPGRRARCSGSASRTCPGRAGAIRGTVEKFIGDAVVAVFGAPVVHEDDPERAVRAALAVRDVAREADAELRVAVNTGEALVSLDAHPLEGEGMVAGDVVNTAARIQSAAPVNGVLVGETTYRATAHLIEYREAASIDAKGKAEPVVVWEAVAPRSRFGSDVELAPLAALVGRQREVDVLRDALTRAREEREPQLVTLVGVPGIGKSRLVAELLQIVGATPELITWRQGRCLSYGDGISFWALSEMTKAQAGILEGDPADEAARKLTDAVAVLVQDPTEARMGRRSPAATRGPRVGRRWRRREPRRGVRRLASLLRGDGRAAADGARLRGSALGGRRPARFHRRARRKGDRRPVVRSLYARGRSSSCDARTGVGASRTRSPCRCPRCPTRRRLA